MDITNRLAYSLRVSGVHLLISLGVAAVCALFVFFILYPHPYYLITRSDNIFAIMIAVDVCAGPLCTLLVSSPSKSKKAKFIDFSVIGLVQVIALLYGLYALYLGRPVYEVYERKKFRAILANEVYEKDYPVVEEKFNHLPSLGTIKQLGTKKFTDQKEQMEVINLEISGVYMGMRPSLWVDYDKSKDMIKKDMLSYEDYKKKLEPNYENIFEKHIKDHSYNKNQLFFLPLDNSNYADWSVILTKEADIIDYIPVYPNIN